MKCSDCAYCITASEHTRQLTNGNFQCDNDNSNAYGLEIFDPANAGCNSGRTIKEVMICKYSTDNQ